jgi:hypothetical protein
MAKSKVDDNGLNSLKRMLKNIEIESNQALFSQEEDKYFFQELMVLIFFDNLESSQRQGGDPLNHR